MSNVDIGPRKTMFILVIVIGCFGVLWPKVFYPMLIGNAYTTPKANSYDKLAAGCCDVIWEHDVDAIKIMFNLCENILSEQRETNPATRLAFENGKLTTSIIETCRKKVLDTCNVDIAAFLTENVRLGRNYRQILDELRSTNSSLCLKYNFGVAPGALWVPHRITVNYVPNIRQERPAHLRPEMLHPALRERGRAIPPSSHVHATGAPQAPRIVPGRPEIVFESTFKPGPIPGMRPTIGGPGHVVPAKTSTSTMSVVMPIYTIGIVVFFTYTLVKIMLKKNDSETNGMYPSVSPDPHFQRHVFNRELSKLERTQGSGRPSKPEGSGKLVVTALSDMLDEVEQRREALAKQREPPRKTSTTNATTTTTTTTITDSEHQVSLTNDISMNGNATYEKIDHEDDDVKPVEPEPEDISKDRVENERKDKEETTTIKVLGMEVTESCEGGQKWSRPSTPIAPPLHLTPPSSPTPAPSILLSGKVPAESQILVSTSSTDEEVVDDEDVSVEEPAIMLSGKITLSVIPSKKDVVENEKNHEENADHEEIEEEEEEEEEYEEEEEDDIEIIYEDDEKKNDELLDDDVEESKYVTVSAATDAIVVDSEEGEEDEEVEEEEEELEDDDEINIKKT